MTQAMATITYPLLDTYGKLNGLVLLRDRKMPIALTTDWTHIPNTKTGATPTSYRYVLDVLAVHVVGARLRTSTFNGIFEVANVQEPFSTYRGESRIEVKVGWFGARPRKTWAHLILGDEWELLSHYTGDVVHNIS